MADAGDLDKLLRQRVAAFKGRDDWTGTFLDNHDEIRTMTRLYVLGVPTESEREQRMNLGTVLLMTVRGIPIIYYGDEQYLAVYNAPGVTYYPQYVNSGSDDPWNRPGMNSWDENTPAFRLISTLARLRKNSPPMPRTRSGGKFICASTLSDAALSAVRTAAIAAAPTINVLRSTSMTGIPSDVTPAHVTAEA